MNQAPPEKPATPEAMRLWMAQACRDALEEAGHTIDGMMISNEPILSSRFGTLGLGPLPRRVSQPSWVAFVRTDDGYAWVVQEGSPWARPWIVSVGLNTNIPERKVWREGDPFGRAPGDLASN